MEFPPDRFSKISGPSQRDAQEALSKISSLLPSRVDVIVDIGSGSGDVSALVADAIPHERFIAVDVDPAMLKYHETIHARPTMEYVKQDIGVPFTALDPLLLELEGNVDFILSNFTLHWVPSPCKGHVAKNIWRLLKPGSLAYFNTFLFNTNIANFCENSEVRSYLKVPNHEEQMLEWERELSFAGFTSISVERKSRNWEYDTIEEFHATRGLAKVYGIWLADDVPSAKRSRLLESLEEAFLSIAVQPYDSKQLQNWRYAKKIHYDIMTIAVVR